MIIAIAMQKKKFKEIREKDLPWFYRMILKIPGTDFLESAGGAFWAILMPIFLMVEYFLSFFLLISFSFPTNIILVSVIPTIMLTLFLKISLRRFINWWNATFGESNFEWNIEKTLDEYLTILKEKNLKKNSPKR